MLYEHVYEHENILFFLKLSMAGITAISKTKIDCYINDNHCLSIIYTIFTHNRSTIIRIATDMNHLGYDTFYSPDKMLLKSI